jgi:hypothetical protein
MIHSGKLYEMIPLFISFTLNISIKFHHSLEILHLVNPCSSGMSTQLFDVLKVNPCSSGMSTQLFDVLKVNPCSSGMSTQLFDVLKVKTRIHF